MILTGKAAVNSISIIRNRTVTGAKMTNTFEFHELIGTVGVGFILLCYFLIQTGKMSAENLPYSILNMAGALLILYSLYFEFNFASVLIESFWVLISLIGITRYLVRKRGVVEDCR